LVLVEAEERGQPISVILQNAETIRLVQSDGKAVWLADLEEGSEVLVCTEKGGRRFWVKIDESIVER
jgi:3-dehydroquinate synthase II